MAIGDVALRKLYCRNNGGIFDEYLVVVFVLFFDATQNRDGIFGTGFVYDDRLKTTHKSFVFLKVLLVFIEGGGTHCAQLTSSQCRLQNIGCIHGAISATSANKRVYFVDK